MNDETNGNGAGSAKVAEAVAAAVDPAAPPPAETKIDLLACPCGEPPGMLRIEMAGKGAKIGQVRGSCCGSWSVEFINNTDDGEKSLVKAAAAWNAAPRAA
jgi:hypothetical protein